MDNGIGDRCSMKVLDLSLSLRLSDARFWLLAIAAGLVAIHVTLTGRLDDPSLLSNSVLVWLAIAYLVWQKRDQLRLTFGATNVLGCIPLAIVLLRSLTLPNANFLAVSPFVSAVGLGWLAAGFSSLRQFWRELTILFFLGFPKVLFALMTFDLSSYTARFAAYVLWYMGLPVTLQGTTILLPTGAIEVYGGCSGWESMLYLLGIAVLFLLVFPGTGAKQMLVPMMAVALGFCLNGFRVCLLAVLVAAQNQAAFRYWHEGSGSLIFSIAGVFLLGLFYLKVVQPNEVEQGLRGDYQARQSE